MNTDRIEKSILLRAPIERVWQAVSDSRQFGLWFGVAFDGPFVQGTRVTGKIAPTTVDAEVAKLQQAHAGRAFMFEVDRIDPMHSIAFRWHPFAIAPGVDYSSEPTTLIVFRLAVIGNDTQLTITESGFDQLPLSRRVEAFQANEGGWSHQVKLIEKYLAIPAKPA
jgi:uncharacterized protein YndB with AHSA1/START domain